jgi:hypothetical protein
LSKRMAACAGRNVSIGSLAELRMVALRAVISIAMQGQATVLASVAGLPSAEREPRFGAG